MDTESCKYFLDVSEGYTFDVVAENNNVNQSTVSKKIRDLEKELGCKLLNRGHRHAGLTEEGKQYRAFLLEEQSRHNQLLRSFAEMKERITINTVLFPRVSLGNCDTLLQDRTLSADGKTLQFVLSSVSSTEAAIRALKKHEADFLISRRLDCFDTAFQMETLAEDPLFFVSDINNPLHDHTEVTLPDIRNEKILLADMMTLEITEEISRHARLPFPTNYVSLTGKSLSTEQLLYRIKDHQGSALLSASELAPYRLDSFTVCKLTDIPAFPLAVYYLHDTGLPSMKAALHYFRKILV